MELWPSRDVPEWLRQRVWLGRISLDGGHREEALAEYELTSEENGALRELYVDASQSESAALDRRETKKVLPFWLTGGL